MTLKQFWQNPAVRLSANVVEPEFRCLYVRKSTRYLPIAGTWTKVDNLLTIANVTAKKEQKGAFTRLLEKINLELRCNVMLENVLNPGFAAALAKNLRFIPIAINEGGEPPCFLRWCAGPDGSTERQDAAALGF